MKKRNFDYIVIIATVAILFLLNSLNLQDIPATYIVVVVIAYYLLGQYSERKFKEQRFFQINAGNFIFR